jgi:penicillin-binding protein 2
MSNRNEYQAKQSVKIFQAVILILCTIVLGRIFYLQIIQHDKYKPLSDKNSLREEYVSAARGLIYDRNGVLLVDNEPIFSVTITPANFDDASIPLLCDILGVDEESIQQRIKEAQEFSWYRSSRLYTDVDIETFSKIQENIYRLPGIGHQIESKRHYPTDLYASHLLGYLREASDEDFNKIDELKLGDKIGKSGLEYVYEDTLRGQMGKDYVRVNAFGQSLGGLSGVYEDLPPVKGSDIITTLDSELQALAEDLMEDKKGAIVAMDPNNGAILAMVSSPHYDVRKLSGRIDREYWVAINADSTTPLYNRAISSLQPPGSTFKPVMGLTGLELGLITPETEIYNSGAYVRGRSYRDLAPVGDYDLKKAISFSSNTYFFDLMNRVATQGKLNEWHALITDLGLGVQNNIDLPSESRGIVPDSSRLDQIFGQRQWSLGDIINLGIGQGLISASPLQVAVMTSVFANDGYRVQPHLVKAVRNNKGEVTELTASKEKIEWIEPEHLQVIKEGMRGVVTEGGGRYYANHTGIEIAGKTGTAQNPHGRDHGWFTSFAPMDSAQIVVTVLVENAGFGSLSAAPIASLLIEKYLHGDIERDNLYTYVKNFKPREELPDE